MNRIPEKYRLPVLEAAEEVNRALSSEGSVVVTAPPGAGKSTLLPLTILDGLDTGGKILMLEPRRIAARQIAERISVILSEEPGGTAGYRMRLESRVSEKTRIEVITEGILSRMLIDDPSLEGVDVVIFDEFHERSLDSDLALALTVASKKLFRPDLKLVIMSATISAGPICAYLKCPLVESRGHSFPVDIRYAPIETDPRTVAAFIKKVHDTDEGSILVFLPGEGEIRRCAALLEGTLGGTSVLPLYGMLPMSRQSEAISPCPRGGRKVVLATPIAETSVTIEGVRIVIDTGLCRKNVFNPLNSLSRLETVRISRDMAAQRSGRAGRTSPGICWRLWDAAMQERMKETRTPEITDADLSPALLTAALYGESDLNGLEWLTPPPSDHVRLAGNLLKSIGALDEEGGLTAAGRRIGTFPCHPRIAAMLLSADTAGQKCLAADIAAIIEERDPMPESGTDICGRLDALRRFRESRPPWERIERISAQYRRMTGVRRDDSPAPPYDAGRLLAAAYPERVARIFVEGRGRYLLSSGETAVMDIHDPLASCRWISIASLNSRSGGDGRIFIAAPVEPEALGFLTRTRESVSWNSKKGEISAVTETRIGRLVLSSKPLSGDISARVTRVICEAAQKEGTSMFDFNDGVGNLQRRIAAAAAWHPELNLPDLSTEAVLSAAPQWVPLYIGTAVTAARMKKIDMCGVLWGMLSYEQQKAVERIAPSHLTVPTGSSIRVEYRSGADAPVLRVRLQECFGLTDTPTVDDGTRPVLMELLSPGYKPVQLTSDLRSFWSGTYFEVRKELRLRYPKHSWPENPLEAEAVRGVPRHRK